ncbi:MAG: glycosyltransferase [Acidobacteriaceae bacterium]|nr:glycosyltransferase [Acidobacteriaceae bacterium]
MTAKKAQNRNSKRILLLINTLTFGGAETQVVRLAIELKDRGWIVAIACLVAPVAYTGQLEENGIPVYSLNMRKGMADLRAIFRLRSLIRDFAPDIVHSHIYHANILGRVTRLFSRIPVLVCTAHNYRETSERGGPTWHKEVLYRATDFLADITTIISQVAFERYIRVGAAPLKKLLMIPNGVDTHLFSPSDQSREKTRTSLGVEASFVWLTVGRLVKQKDYPTLFRALRLLDRKDYVLLIAGSGPLEAELKEECTRLGLAERVRFCGAREDILDLYRIADAFVMSSEFEGLSAALLEAASVGLPAVVTKVGGNGEIVIHGRTGYLVPPGNPEALAVSMESLINAPLEYRRRLGLAARQYCSEKYSIETIAQKWIELYDFYLSPVVPDSVPVCQIAAESESQQ